MEVKIGIADSGRELVVSSASSPEDVHAQVEKALADGKGLLTLVDDKGRQFLVPSARVAYVEIAPTSPGRVGFAVGG